MQDDFKSQGRENFIPLHLSTSINEAISSACQNLKDIVQVLTNSLSSTKTCRRQTLLTLQGRGISRASILEKYGHD